MPFPIPRAADLLTMLAIQKPLEENKSAPRSIALQAKQRHNQ
jgi:hypothetical protein